MYNNETPKKKIEFKTEIPATDHTRFGKKNLEYRP